MGEGGGNRLKDAESYETLSGLINRARLNRVPPHQLIPGHRPRHL
jgi:hypothetical protein